MNFHKNQIVNPDITPISSHLDSLNRSLKLDEALPTLKGKAIFAKDDITADAISYIGAGYTASMQLRTKNRTKKRKNAS